MKRPGTVYLVGAGPGDPGLITEKGREVLGRADLVLYDHLAHPALLRHARPGARRVCVGKAGGGRSALQSRINRALVRAARAGMTVVRLKGGDPMLFGRGAEEARYLARAGISCEAVPGVSAALAVPTAAGIPLTLRGLSSSVTILTGHEAERGVGGVDWGRVLRADSTFVVLMGVRNLGEIVARFLDAGKSPRLPAAIVENGCTPRQRIVAGTLGRIAGLARARRIAPPAVLIVGETASRRLFPRRRARAPLRGARVLVTRPAGQSERLIGLLAERGAAPFPCPLIELRPPRGFAALDRALATLGRHDWVIFTSANGVRACVERLRLLGRDARAFAGIRICAIGPATAGELSRFGLRADCVPRRYTGEGIVVALLARDEVRGRSFLLPTSDIAGDALPEGLRARGGRCLRVAAYRTVPSAGGIAESARLLREEAVDAALLTSPSAAGAYARAVRRAGRVRLPLCAAIGPVTAEAAARLGIEIAFAAATHTDEGLVRALEGFWRRWKGPCGRGDGKPETEKARARRRKRAARR